MTSKLKCPFCGETMEECKGELHDFYGCHKTSCFEKYGWFSASVLQALIQAKQDLAKAIDVIDTVRQHKRGTAIICPNDIAAYCDKAIEQLEHKE